MTNAFTGLDRHGFDETAIEKLAARDARLEAEATQQFEYLLAYVRGNATKRDLEQIMDAVKDRHRRLNTNAARRFKSGDQVRWRLKNEDGYVRAEVIRPKVKNLLVRINSSPTTAYLKGERWNVGAATVEHDKARVFDND